jgi:hypothetical protein
MRIQTLYSGILITTLTCLCLFSSGSDAFAFGRKPVEPPVTPTPTPTPTPPTADIIRGRWEGKQRDGALWSAYVYKQIDVLGKNLVAKNPSDIAAFCANYPNLSADDKKNFWVYLISAMSEKESNHNPASQYTEAFNDQNGNRVVSRGLLQISIESGNAYGCGFKNESELHDPYKNLDCGLRILNRWLGQDGRLAGRVNGAWRGGARYWSVLRSTNAPLGQIISWTQNQDICLVR